jgi:hypothetical protein
VCGAVQEFPGLAPEIGFGTGGIQWETPSVQVVFRGAPGDYNGPRLKAEAAYLALAAVGTEVLSAGVGGTSAFYHNVHPQGAPSQLVRDDKDRAYIGFTVLCEKEPSA